MTTRNNGLKRYKIRSKGRQTRRTRIRRGGGVRLGVEMMCGIWIDGRDEELQVNTGIVF